MLYLLNKDVRTVRWNGEPLHEATSAIVKETMNGDFTLTVKYPISDSGIYQLIQEDMLIKAPTPVLGAQLFRIKKPVEHNDHLEITAYHISDDVMQRSITPVSVTSQSCGMALSRMVQNTKTALGDFSFNSDIQDRRTFNTIETETLYSVLLDGKHSIVGTWEGELVRDNFAITVKKSRGENRGVVITTHKNLKDYQRTKNSQNVVTRIHAKSTFKPEGAEKETTIRVTVDSPLINSYPYINEKEYENNNAKSVEELQKWAQAKFSNEGIDKVSDAIKIEAYELDGQVVHMGDTVNLKSWKHNADAFKKAIAYEFDALKEEYISLIFDDKAGTGGSRSSGGLSSAADAILGVTESAQEIALEKALQNADLGFDHQAGLLRQEILDGIELARAKAEEVKRELSDTINQRFNSFDISGISEAKRKADEALRNAGASTLLAQEAKRIGLDSVAKLEEFKKQATSAQTALSGDLDSLKRTVTSEVNQASEYRRTTTEALSRMTGQMNGFATKSEVRQDVAGLTETFAKLKTDTNNLISGAKSEITLAKTEFKKTADGLSAKMSAVESYVGQDGQRQEALRRYTREESARQATAVRELVTRDYVGKASHQEDVRAIERKFEAITNPQNGSIATQIATYRNAVDGRFTEITSMISGKANQTDFQRVKETSQLYERIIGSNENDISNKVARMALTNQLFQVEVAKNVGDNRNYVKNADFRDRSKSWRETNVSGLNFNYDHSTTQRGKTGVHIYGSAGTMEFYGIYQTFKFEGSKNDNVILSFLASKDGANDFSGIKIGIHCRKNNAIISQMWRTIQNSEIARLSYKKISLAFNLPVDVDEINLMFYGEQNKVINLYISEIKFEKGSNATSFTLAPEDTEEAVRSVQSQLAGSWSVQNINSAGDLISGINLGANGHNRFVGKLTHITGETLIDKAVIKSAMVDKLKTANFEAGSVTTIVLDAEAVTAEKLKVDQALFNKLVANEAYLSQLFAKQAFINRVQSVAIDASQVRSGILSGDRIYGGTIRGTEINGTTITGNSRITIGDNGFLRPTQEGGLQINVPETYSASKGIGVQLFGRNFGQIPKGMFIYNSPNWNGGNLIGESVADTLLTVKGLTSLCNLYRGKPMSGLPINSNFRYGNPVGNLYRISFIAWDPRSGQMYVNDGTDTDGTWWFKPDASSSDKRLKVNIQDTDFEATDFVKKLEFKQFDWKPDKFGYKKPYTNVGLIAQDIEKLDTSLVYSQGENLALDDFRLLNISLKAIQELSQRIETLERKLA